MLERLVDYGGAPQREDGREESSMIFLSLLANGDVMQAGSVRASVLQKAPGTAVRFYVDIAAEGEEDAAHCRVGLGREGRNEVEVEGG
jgi:hypothetical protein